MKVSYDYNDRRFVKIGDSQTIVFWRLAE